MLLQAFKRIEMVKLVVVHEFAVQDSITAKLL